MATLKLNDKIGEAHLYTPGLIIGFLYVDEEYVAHIMVEGDMSVRLTGSFHTLRLEHGGS